ncbi:hypothetical protein M2440_002154 [Methylorubrum extorquens]|nr:hypothetical protein [Methylorubrum extorquens]
MWRHLAPSPLLPQGMKIGTNLSFTYDGFEYSDYSEVTISASGGTIATIKTGDSYYLDNVDRDGNYGFYIGNPDIIDNSDIVTYLYFPNDGLSHFVQSANIDTLDASQIIDSTFIDAGGYGTSASYSNGSVLIMNGAPAHVVAGQGNDTIIASLTGQTINGGAGNDTVIIQANLSSFNLSGSGKGFASLNTDIGALDLVNIERLIFDDGSIDLNGGLIDNLYYAHSNLDVYASGSSADAHYSQFGWHEGRDPNAFFSTTSYLAANPDVAKAGINPLEHFDQFGWKEGRDPSAAFDNELYLARNADVKAAGMDPLLHFLDNGQAEGRKAYAAVGNASDLAKHEGFDAQYYLLANADVAKAALAAGGDTFNFAYQHFDEFGWKEGRDPNAIFDTKGYLDAYKDVAAAGINPLDHFHDYGWKEGRDAAADFDTKGYLAANADVNAVGVDPMLHYLQNGALEGRLAFNDGHFG